MDPISFFPSYWTVAHMNINSLYSIVDWLLYFAIYNEPSVNPLPSFVSTILKSDGTHSFATDNGTSNTCTYALPFAPTVVKEMILLSLAQNMTVSY